MAEGIIQLIFGGVNLVAIGWMVYTQHRIIKNYEAVFKNTDIKRVIEYYSTLDKLGKETVLTQVQLQTSTFFQEVDSKFRQQYDEMATFIFSIYEVLPDEDKDWFINQHLPHCKSLFGTSNTSNQSTP